MFREIRLKISSNYCMCATRRICGFLEFPLSCYLHVAIFIALLLTLTLLPHFKVECQCVFEPLFDFDFVQFQLEAEHFRKYPTEGGKDDKSCHVVKIWIRCKT